MINNYLDKLVRTEVGFLHRRWSVFKLCACTGLALAIVMAMILVSYLGLSYWVVAVLVLSSVAAYSILRMVTEAIIGRDALIHYHHVIAVILTATVVSWLLRQPVLPYLDVTIIGLGIILFCGRLGCLMVGCCHGRPHNWGVCYREEHAVAGIRPYFVGVRLFPVQCVESLWALGLALVGAAFVLAGRPPGDAFSWYLIAYATGRFCFEFMRGDPARPYLGGFSEAQWTSLVLMCVIVWVELSGPLTFHPWHALATACLMLAMVVVTLARRLRKAAKHLLLHPRHVDEVAQAVEWIANPAAEETAISEEGSVPPVIKIGTTSLGIQISASAIKQGGNCIYHYALSSQTGTISEEIARILAGLILKLKHPCAVNELTKGNRGVFHLLIHPGQTT